MRVKLAPAPFDYEWTLRNFAPSTGSIGTIRDSLRSHTDPCRRFQSQPPAGAAINPPAGAAEYVASVNQICRCTLTPWRAVADPPRLFCACRSSSDSSARSGRTWVSRVGKTGTIIPILSAAFAASINWRARRSFHFHRIESLMIKRLVLMRRYHPDLCNNASQ